MPEMNRTNIEAAISDVLTRFLREHLQENVTDVRTEMTGDTVVIRLRHTLPQAEKSLSRASGGKKMIKEFKEKLIERSRPLLERMISTFTGARITDIRSSFDPDTAERIEIFILEKSDTDTAEGLPSHDNRR